MTRSLSLASLSLALCLACGAPSAPIVLVSTESPAPTWTDDHLDRLDPDLAVTVRRGTDERLAVKVFFHRRPPGDDVLSSLLLTRLGLVAVGQVQIATLHRIASRDDVRRIEALRDTGY
ncbi:MAG: hypothetical protein KF729_31000 [Sandaracinaceae bacterium]|nr:hypothetical protein [Sandaracinaceae bacterium]